MAQNISLLGANYADVPAVDLPKTGGGTARFDDTTDATAIASDILLGKTAYVNGEKITGTNQGGSEDGSVWKDNEGFVVLDDQPGVNVSVGPLSVTANGTYTAPTGTAYSPVSVDVTLTPNLQNKSVSPTESQQTVTADNGYDGLGTVTVGAISSTYVGTGITRRSSSDLTASGATVSVPSGYYQNNASKAVASGTAGTPTATKGSVSNHAVSVTPSVTNTTGYITGSTKTGTAVSVSASELVSGTKSITENGVGIDVTNYAEVDVEVPSSGGNDFVITLSKNQNDEWEPGCAYSDAETAFLSGKNVVFATDEYFTFATGEYQGISISVDIIEVFDEYSGDPVYNWGLSDGNYNWTSNYFGLTYSESYYYTGDADASPSDVIKGKTFLNANGIQTGTRRNVVEGTFEFDSGGSKTVSIPYTGNGYPVEIFIEVSGGIYGSDWQSLLRRYAVGRYTWAKDSPSSTPTYTGDSNDIGRAFSIYKSSTSDASAMDMNAYSNSYYATLTSSSPSSSYARSIVTMSNATTMKVYVSSSYSFQMNYQYLYRIVYSE